jgi:hypothetical protein
MSKHTPGPWRMTLDDFGDYTIQPPNEELAIAAVVNGEMRRIGGRSTEHEANARLIAAAPEVRAAAKAIAEPDCFYDGSNIVIRCDSHGDAIRRMRVLRDALAKAEGNPNV